MNKNTYEAPCVDIIEVKLSDLVVASNFKLKEEDNFEEP